MRFEIKVIFKDRVEELLVDNFSEFEKSFNKMLEKKELYYDFSIKEKRKNNYNWHTYSGRDELIGEWLPTKLYLKIKYQISSYLGKVTVWTVLKNNYMNFYKRN